MEQFGELTYLIDFLRRYWVKQGELSKVISAYWSLYFYTLMEEHVPYELEEDNHRERTKIVDAYLELNPEVPKNYVEISKQLDTWPTASAPRPYINHAIIVLKAEEYDHAKPGEPTVDKVLRWTLALRCNQ